MTRLPHQARAFFSLARASRLKKNIGPTTSVKKVVARTAFTDANPQKPFYVTSPIFYVNASPHAGHLYTLVLADVLKRWQQLRGDKRATLLTGTDEHGMKIQKAAKKADTDVKLFCDQHAKQFDQLCRRADISYDRFIRTTDPDHREAVQHFWRELNHNGYIYESKHEGWYCVSDETFYPESRVHLILEPSSGRKMYASMETGKEVEWTSEVNYHFRLSAFQERLLEHYRANATFVVPSSRMNYLINEVESGLADLSISRPASRLTWGIPVPDDDSQTIYVWLDALINYLTMAGYPFTPGQEVQSIWPPNVQVIGKDIIRFHCIYWPAFLMALNLPIPKQFLSHAHWLLNDEKMSKSAGNVVNPFFAIDRFDVDVMRYYMVHDGGIVDDAYYENAYIIQRYKKGLQGGLGNLVSRIVRGQKWNVRESVIDAETNTNSWDPAAPAHRTLLDATRRAAAQHMQDLNPRAALQAIMEIVYATNVYLQQTNVWDTVKNPSPESQQQVKAVIYLCAESVRIASILLQPFMPTKMKQALDLLGVDPNRRNFDDARLGADYTYGKALIDPGRAGATGTLFPPLVAEW